MGADNQEGATRLPEAESLFRLDTRGDRQNLAYGGLHQASIPKYRTAGRGNVIGLDKGFRILKSSDSRRKVLASGLYSNFRTRQPAAFIAEPQSSQLVRVPPEQNNTITDQIDYVALDSRHARKRRHLSTQHDSQSSDESESPSPTKGGDPSASATDGDAFQDNVLQRQRVLGERTSKQPERC